MVLKDFDNKANFVRKSFLSKLFSFQKFNPLSPVQLRKLFVNKKGSIDIEKVRYALLKPSQRCHLGIASSLKHNKNQVISDLRQK